MVRLFLVFDCDLSFSDDDVDESSSGCRVNRSKISGGNTAPNDKIRFPPAFFALCAALGGNDCVCEFDGAAVVVVGTVAIDDDAAAAGKEAVDLEIAADEVEDADEADESLP